MILKSLVDKINKHNNPINYARKIGVKIGNNCSIDSTVIWGRELIS